MSIKIWICSLFFLISSSRTPSKSNHWGFFGHKKINELAVFTLPTEMIGFYKDHIDYLRDNAVLPDKRRYIIASEGPKHFIDLDHYKVDSIPMPKWVPLNWKSACEKFSKDTLLTYGILPWNIQWVMRKLEKAFKDKKPNQILKYSAEIGHYVSDAHVPLHTTENYNGQFTNQNGIHGLWESRLVEVYFEDYEFFVGKSRYIEKPLHYIWQVVYESHENLDQVLEFERVASDSIGQDKKFTFEKRGEYIIKTYSIEFSSLYHELMEGLVQERMRKSVLSVGSIWFSAWVNAGQPDLSGISSDKIQMRRETKDSLDAYQRKRINIKRVHEH